MKFNNELKVRDFRRKWDMQIKEYREAGMKKKVIRKMIEYDWQLLKEERTFCRHNQFIGNAIFENGDEVNEDKDPLLNKFFDSFSYEERYFQNERYEWIEQLDNSLIEKEIKSMDEKGIEILTQFFMEERTQAEIAENMGISQQAISKRINKFKKFCKKVVF